MHRFTVLCLVLLCACAQPKSKTADIYDGKVYGIFDPLNVSETDVTIKVSGGTFAYEVDKLSGQIISAVVLGEEFLAGGTSFPNPYIGLIPEGDVGANQLGGTDRPKYSFEKAVQITPKLWSGDLTNALRFDADEGIDIETELVSHDHEQALVKSQGIFANRDDRSPTPVHWEIEYLFDVDGFTKVTVKVETNMSVKLRWNCFNHAFLAEEVNQLLFRWTDPTAPPVTIRPEPVTAIRNKKEDEPIIESHFCPGIHLGNSMTGIEFFKMDFADRWSGGHDGSDVVETADGRKLRGYDSRGRTNILTQIYKRDGFLEYEEFDIRNSTHPLEPNEVRQRTFWVQMTPAKRQRDDLHSFRAVWPGPHQINMAGWWGRREPWSPASDERIKMWAQMGVYVIIGGANYFSGDYSNPSHPDKIDRFVATAHKHGIKVIPYVTFSDLNHDAPAYQTHSDEWKYSGSQEFRDFTTLMCYGSEGWREHWEREVDALMERFDFDGLYIDHWVGTLLCANANHGCGGYIGRFVVEGYHDLAKRARRVVARHTDGKGIILLNSDSILFSGVIPWMDVRLNGEHWGDPDQLPSESLLSIWNGKPQGVQALSMWRSPPKDNREMVNFNNAYSLNFHYSALRRMDDLSQWSEPGRETGVGLARYVWDVSRFFRVNGSKRHSNFDSRDVIEMSMEGSQANAFTNGGRVLVALSYLLPGKSASAEPMRRERLSLLAPEELGIDPEGKYRIVDLNNNRYLDEKTYTATEMEAIPVQLELGEPTYLLIEPAYDSPRLVYFLGADGVEAGFGSDKVTFKIDAVAGSPLELHLETGGGSYRSLTPGIAEESARGDFVVFSGSVPEDKTVVLAR